LLACTRTYLYFAFQPIWPQVTSPVLLHHQLLLLMLYDPFQLI
jgi:hypothetical protein